MQEFHSKVIDRFFFSLVEPSIGLFSLRISFIVIFSPDAEQTGIFTSLNQALKNFFKKIHFFKQRWSVVSVNFKTQILIEDFTCVCKPVTIPFTCLFLMDEHFCSESSLCHLIETCDFTLDVFPLGTLPRKLRFISYDHIHVGYELPSKKILASTHTAIS